MAARWINFFARKKRKGIKVALSEKEVQAIICAFMMCCIHWVGCAGKVTDDDRIDKER